MVSACFEISNKEDRPTLHSSFVFLKNVPNNYDNDEGFTVADIIKGVPDKYAPGRIVETKESKGKGKGKPMKIISRYSAFVTDSDSEKIGIAITFHKGSFGGSLGQWHYKPANGDWQPIRDLITNKTSTNKMLLLRPESRLRLLPKSNGSFWDINMAKRHPLKIYAYAWDGSTKSEGPVDMN